MTRKVVGISLILLPIIVILIYILYIFLKNYIKYRHMDKFIKDERKKHKLKYYGEIPSGNTAVGVAFLVEPLNRLTCGNLGNVTYRIIQATILELSINGTIEIIQDENQEVILKFTNKNEEMLKNSQILILNLLKKYKNSKNEIKIEDFKEYMKLDKEAYKNTFDNEFARMIIDEQSKIGNCGTDRKEYNKMYNEMLSVSVSVFVMAFISMYCFITAIGQAKTNIKIEVTPILNMPMIILGILTLLMVICGIITIATIATLMAKGRKIIYNRDQTKIDLLAILSKEGISEREQWLALKNFLKDNTLIKDYDINSLVINEKYLVYATLFGVADETQEDLGKYGPIVFDWK